ncbi:MAG: hypothetical protein JNL90_13615 [Planctomycetes bacterium]|nr:hypothetical protein [Planctomycetota bacterium]
MQQQAWQRLAALAWAGATALLFGCHSNAPSPAAGGARESTEGLAVASPREGAGGNVAADDSAALSLFLRGRIAQGLGQRAQARALLTEAASLAPRMVPVQLAVAQLLLSEGDEPGALQALDAALAVAPDDVAANLLRARFELRHHELDHALARLLRLEAAGHADVALYELLHPLLLYAGEPARGLVLFERARDRFPQEAVLHEACADFLHCTGHEEAALAGYRRALALDPTRRSAELKAARLLEEQGDRILRRLARPVGAGLGLPAAQEAVGGGD